MKKLVICSWMLMQVVMALPVSAESGGQANRVGRVSGQATFERRTAVVPGTMQATPYWSLVLHAEGVSYELAQVFALNSEERPGAIEVQGAVVHPGDQVMIDGRVQQVKKDMGLLSEVGKIKVVHSETDNSSD